MEAVPKHEPPLESDKTASADETMLQPSAHSPHPKRLPEFACLPGVMTGFKWGLPPQVRETISYSWLGLGVAAEGVEKR